ncbi:hypothetical protein WME75_32130 [Sorangium sp. So ce1014]|uniref:hypothetical protein n=1 Tax=Sorangium sp. So ce1014 TaxID=3133326 RepID=UPI003F5EFF82
MVGLNQVPNNAAGVTFTHSFGWKSGGVVVMEVRPEPVICNLVIEAPRTLRNSMRGFTGVCAGFVARLQAEGALADEWSASGVADFLATILSIGNWQELIEERSWSRPRYVHAMRRSVEQSLLRPMEIKTAPRRRS